MNASKKRSLSGPRRRSQRWTGAEKARALEFFKAVEGYLYPSIIRIVHKRRLALSTLEYWTHCALNDRRLMRQEEWRNAVIAFIVEFLPHTFRLLGEILKNYNAPFWYEVQFTTLSWLVRSEYSASEQRKILALVENNLMNARSEAGCAAWKAGDMLGDEWFGADTVKILERTIYNARYAAGRKGAIHGMAHAIGNSSAAKQKQLFLLMHQVSLEDRSAAVRDYASYHVKGSSCGVPRKLLSWFKRRSVA